MNTTISRRDFLKKAGLSAGAAGLALGGSWPVSGQSAINVVAILPLTGTFAGPGNEALRGVQLSLDGAQAGGRPINLIVEDTGTTPAQGLEKAQKVLADDTVDFVIGPISSAVTAAIRDRVLQSRAIWFIPTTGAGASPTVPGLCSDRVFAGVNTFSLSNAFAPWVKDNVADEAYLFFSNYVFGQSTAEQFTQGFEGAGGTIVGQSAPPLGTNDFAPFLTEVANAGPRALFVFIPGGPAIDFVKQFSEFGLNDSIKLTGLGSSFINLFLPAMGDAAVGAISSLHYGPEQNLPANVAFKDAYAAAYGRPTGPSFYAMMGFDFGNTVIGSANATGGDTSDGAALSKVIETLDINSPRGPLSYSLQTHDPIQNIYIRETRKVSGKTANIVVDVLPNVVVPQEVGAGGICDLSA